MKNLLSFMKEINTIIHIHAPSEIVWETLMNFKDYPDWNPFIKSIEGNPVRGESISVTVQPPDGRSVTFKPSVLKSDKQKEFRWRGKLIVKGLFDGEHYFILTQLPNGSTAVNHGESFSGLIVPLMRGVLQKTEKGFKRMNIALKEHCEQKYKATKNISV